MSSKYFDPLSFISQRGEFPDNCKQTSVIPKVILNVSKLREKLKFFFLINEGLRKCYNFLINILFSKLVNFN